MNHLFFVTILGILIGCAVGISYFLGISYYEAAAVVSLGAVAGHIAS